MIPKATFEGRIRDIFQSEIVGQNFEKRVFYIEEPEGRYPNVWKLECQQGKCNELDLYKKGDDVIVEVEITGRPWTSKKTGEEIIFMTHKVVDIRLARPRQTSTTPPPALGYNPPNFTSEPVKDCPQPEPEDDLPF